MKKVLLFVLICLSTLNMKAQILGAFDCKDPDAWFDKEIYFIAQNNFVSAFRRRFRCDQACRAAAGDENLLRRGRDSPDDVIIELVRRITFFQIFHVLWLFRHSDFA